jgi:hypothetical protein
MTIDERLEALTLSVELLQATVHGQSATVDKILLAIQRDSENIAALARIAQAHEGRIADLEDKQ